MIDDFEKKHGDVLRARSPDYKQQDTTPLYSSDQRDMFAMSSEGFGRSIGIHSQKENSPQLKSLEFEFLLLQKKCEELGKERDRLKKEVIDSKKPGVHADLLPKFIELSENNDKLAKDNAKLVKVAKKLEQKSAERKVNLKKLFDLIAEKENELKFYKESYNAVAGKGTQEGKTSLSLIVLIRIKK